jgi:Protein of unknown function DUF262
MPQNFLDFTRRSITQIKKHWDAGELEIHPPFQRNPVWSDKQKSLLIDTILRGYPIPELYVHEYVNEKGEERFVIVDGQQRIRACLEFIEGEFALSDPEDSQWFDKTFDELSPEDKQQIFSYNFMVRQLPVLPETQMVDIFKRINRNTVSLNKQELRHATYWGEFIRCAETIADDPLWEDLRIFSANDIRRMSDAEFISELIIGFLHGIQNKKSTIDKYYVLYEKEFEQRKEVERVFRITLSELRGVLVPISNSRWRKKSDFYSLFLAIAPHLNQMSLSSNQRSRLTKALDVFGTSVDAYLRNKEAGRSPAVKKYADAVERAATDLANREARHAVLDEIIRKAIGISTARSAA